MGPELLWSVKAHDSAICHIELLNEPEAVLTSGSDRCVCLWSRVEGFKLGILLQV